MPARRSVPGRIRAAYQNVHVAPIAAIEIYDAHPLRPGPLRPCNPEFLTSFNVTPDWLNRLMDMQNYFLPTQSRQLLADLRGQEIGTIGSPESDFRESWRAPFGSIFLEIGSKEYELSTFSSAEQEYGSPKVLNFREIPQRTKRQREFPRYGWFKGSVIEEIYIVRDTVELEQEHWRSHYAYDQAVILQSQTKMISLFMMQENFGGVALGHEPTVKQGPLLHTQPAPYYTNSSILQSRQTREMRPLEVAWS